MKVSTLLPLFVALAAALPRPQLVSDHAVGGVEGDRYLGEPGTWDDKRGVEGDRYLGEPGTWNDKRGVEVDRFKGEISTWEDKR